MYKLLFLSAFLICSNASATDVSFRLDAGELFALSNPQYMLFNPGVASKLKLAVSLNRYVDVGPTVGFLWVPGYTSSHDGIGFTAGAGFRVKRPHNLTTYAGLSPWFDADALYFRTGTLNMVGWDAGAGFSIPLEDKHRYWLGPFARFTQSVRTSDPTYDHHDVNLFVFGLEFEFGTAGIQPQPAFLVDCPAPEVEVVTKEVPVVQECPPPASLPVVRKKLILKEKLYFATNKDTILPLSQPALDEVMAALHNDDSPVEIVGYTDSTGTPAHNLELSLNRAKSVLKYLAAHGINNTLTAYGKGQTEPADTNKTKEGRAVNRRVEFFVISE